MTILFRYMVREYLKIFAMCLSGLMTVYLVVDFFEKVRKFIRYDAELSAMFAYFALRTPAIVFQIAPMAVLMATLLTLGLLSRNHEITAMRSCGISLYRIALPFLVCAFCIALVLLGLSAVAMPVSSAQAEYVKAARIEKKPALATFTAQRPWLQAGPRLLINVEAVDPDGSTLRGVTLYRLTDTFQLDAITESRELRYEGDGWTMHQAVQRTLFPDGRLRTDTFDRLPVSLSQKPEDFRSWAKMESEEMTLPALADYTDRLRRDGYSFSRPLTDFHGRIAFPFVCVVMTLVGIALSLRRTGVRGSGIAVGIGQALALGFLYWAAHSVAIAFGRTAVLTPMVAGWLANLMFFSFGCYLLLNVRQ